MKYELYWVRIIQYNLFAQLTLLSDTFFLAVLVNVTYQLLSALYAWQSVLLFVFRHVRQRWVYGRIMILMAIIIIIHMHGTFLGTCV